MWCQQSVQCSGMMKECVMQRLGVRVTTVMVPVKESWYQCIADPALVLHSKTSIHLHFLIHYYCFRLLLLGHLDISDLFLDHQCVVLVVWCTHYCSVVQHYCGGGHQHWGVTSTTPHRTTITRTRSSSQGPSVTDTV